MLSLMEERRKTAAAFPNVVNYEGERAFAVATPGGICDLSPIAGIVRMDRRTDEVEAAVVETPLGKLAGQRKDRAEGLS